MPSKDPLKIKAARKRFYERHGEKVRKEVAQRKADLIAWYVELKKTLKCEKCGENRYYCLEFHHSDPNEKEMMISVMPNSGYSKERILREIEKCIVLCANCHKEAHFRENKRG